MYIFCDREVLSESLTNVSRAVSQKSPIKTLEGVLLKAKDGKLTLTGYDLEIGITTSIDVKVENEGEVVVEARLINDIIRRLPENNVSIEVDDRLIVTIKSGAAEFAILGMPAGEYPQLPVITDGDSFEINQNLLKGMIRQTLFAVSKSEVKPVHMGTLFEISDNQFTMVALDGYRLALRREPVKCDKNMSFVVPGKTQNELLKMIKDEDTTIKIVIGTKHAIFVIDEYSVVTRLLEGDFLDYRSSVPTACKTELIVKVRSYLESVERASLLISDRLKSPLKCVFSENEAQISCSTTMGKVVDQFPVALTGERVVMGFNHLYLQEALRATESDEVKIKLNGPLSPMVILPKEGEEFLFLVLPVRLRNEG